MKGYGVEYLRFNIETIKKQTFTDYEIIVSDHSVNDDIEELCDSIPDIRYIRNACNRGSSSANLNKGILFASGQIIKPMFQDDYFHDTNALSIIHNILSCGAKWVVCGNNVAVDHNTTLYNFIPRWNDKIIYGNNTLSSPSCMAYLKCNEHWDERLIWLMDCNFYWRLFQRFGLPYLENRILITNFGHPNQLGKLIPPERKHWEVDLMKKEYPYITPVDEKS